jgi:hypothetical protein
VPGVATGVVMSAAHHEAGTGAAGHLVHYGVLIGGLVVVVAVGIAETRGGRRDRASTAARGLPEHDERTVADRSSATVGRANAGAVGTQSRERGARASLSPTREELPLAERVVVPVALVSSVAAAVAHAAVCPAHFEEGVLFGMFFAVSALLQLLWAGLLAVHRSRPLLAVGAAGNLAIVGLWAVTRTVGLPFGLLPEPEAVGPWDLACGMWELAVVGCCLGLLRSSRNGGRVAPWREWHVSVQLFVAGSALLLAALSLSGAGA